MQRGKERLGARGQALAIGVWVVLLLLGPPSVGANPPPNGRPVIEPRSPSSPFEPEKEPLRYYPDEIDHTVRKAIIAAYLGNGESLRTHLDFLRREDEARRREGRPVTGLSTGVRDLYHSMLTDRETFLEAQKAAMDKMRESENEAVISWRLAQDELTQADELYHKSIVTRVGKVLNRVLRSVNLTSFILDPLMAPAIDSAVDVLLHFGELNRMNVEERKALVLYQQFLARYPEDPEVERVKQDVNRLMAKKREALLEKHIEQGETALEAGDLWMAEHYFGMALRLDAVSDEAEAGMEMVRALRQAQQDRQAETLRSSLESLSFTSPSDEALYYTLLLATTRRQPTMMRAAAQKLASHHHEDSLGDIAADVMALAYELEGQKEKADEVLEELAGNGSSALRQEQARLLLDDPHYNQLVAIRAAEHDHVRKTLSYILGGKETLKQALVQSPTTILLYGTPAAIPIGAATAAGVGLRGIRVLTGNPVSRSAIIEAAGQYLREHPRDDAHYRDVCLLLAEAYEKEDRYDRALYYYREAEAAPDEIHELEERVAEMLLKRADETPPVQRAGTLAAILRNYPETQVAREAGRRFRELLAPQYQGLRLSKQFLQEHPAVAQEGLRLKPSLLDDDPDNTEIASDGVTLLETGLLVITFESPEGTRARIYHLDRKTAERVLRILRQDVYEGAFDKPGEAVPLLTGHPDLPTFLFARDPAQDRVDREPEVHLKPSEFLGTEEQEGQSFLPFPQIQGSASTNGVRLEGLLPYEPLGTRLSIGLDESSPFIGADVPVPGPVPLNFRVNAAPNADPLPSISPQLRLFQEKMPDASLYE